jgi:hypothetical protein
MMHFSQGFSIDGFGLFQTIPSPPGLLHVYQHNPSEVKNSEVKDVTYTIGAGTLYGPYRSLADLEPAIRGNRGFSCCLLAAEALVASLGDLGLLQVGSVALTPIDAGQSSGPDMNLMAFTTLDAESANEMSVVFMADNQAQNEKQYLVMIKKNAMAHLGLHIFISSSLLRTFDTSCLGRRGKIHTTQAFLRL